MLRDHHAHDQLSDRKRGPLAMDLWCANGQCPDCEERAVSDVREVAQVLTSLWNRIRCPGGRVWIAMETPQVEFARASDGVTIAHTSVGSGPALVHLPGVPFSNFEAEWRVPALRSAFGLMGA